MERPVRSLRARAVMLAALGSTLAVAGSAEANSVSAAWISAPAGSVGLGTPTLLVGPGNTGAQVVLEVRVNASAIGVNAVGVVFQYDPAVLGAASESRCPAAPGNLAAGICGTNPSGLLATNSEAVNVPGMIGGIQTGGVPPGGQDTLFTYSHMTFTIQPGGGTTGNLFYRPGVDGVVTTAAVFTTPPLGPASITVPEPGKLELLAAGLGFLAFLGRFRR